MTRAAKVVGNIIIIVVLCALFLAVFELILRIVDSSKGTSGRYNPAAPLSGDMLPRAMVRNLMEAFDEKYSKEEIKKMFPLVQDQLKYAPWIQIGNADHKNEFSVVENGLRETLKSKSCANTSINGQNSKTQPHTIWFYGGSTTYGIGVPWWDTIPSKFVEEADRNHTCVRALNFGVPYHFSRQEAIYFASNLMKEPAPDVVVFLDGLNEFGQPGSTIRSEPFFTPTLDRLVPVGANPGVNPQKSKAHSDFGSTISSFFRNLHMAKWLGLSPGDQNFDAEKEKTYSNAVAPKAIELSTNEQIANAIVLRYIETRKFLSNVCDSYLISCFQFLQPVAAVDYSPQESEVVTQRARKHPESANKFLVGYPIMREAFKVKDVDCSTRQKGLKYIDISSLFKNYNGIAYVDNGHYAPRANKLIAEKMFECIFASP